MDPNQGFVSRYQVIFLDPYHGIEFLPPYKDIMLDHHKESLSPYQATISFRSRQKMANSL